MVVIIVEVFVILGLMVQNQNIKEMLGTITLLAMRVAKDVSLRTINGLFTIKKTLLQNIKENKMKQHITENQLNELSEKGKKRLRKWWKPAFADWCSDGLYRGIVDRAGYRFVGKIPPAMNYQFMPLPLLSIGQMIELLDEHNRGSESANILPTTNDINKDYIDVKPVDEWCDAFWEAVKVVLENNNG